MKVAEPVELSAEELAGFNAPPPPALKVAPPVDALDDFDVYNMVEDEKERRGYDPADPGVAMKLWNGVKGVASLLPAAAKGAFTIATGPLPGQGRKATALITQTAGEVAAGYRTLAKGVETLVDLGGAKLATMIAPEREAEFKQVARKAAWNFQREARDVDQFTGLFNQYVETKFPDVMRGLSAVPVDREAAQGLALFADPTNLIPFGAAARVTSTVPLRGAVRAANSAVKEAAREVAMASARRETAMKLLRPGLDNAEWKNVSRAISEASEQLRLAEAKKAQAANALVNTTAAQRAEIDHLATQASALPLVTRMASVGAQGAGVVAQNVSRALEFGARMPEMIGQLAGRLGADEAAQMSISQGVTNVASGFGLVPGAINAAAGVAERAGRSASAYGRILAEAESQLPFFKRLARETEGVSKFTASLIDQSGAGALITPAARVAAEATRGLPAAAALGYVGSGGQSDGALEAVGGGLVFGLAGGAYGQWQRYSNGSLFRQRQLADVARYRTTIPTEEARSFYAALPASDQAAIATMQLANPDLKIQYSRMGKQRPSFHYVADDGPVAVVNLDTRDALPAVVAHEIGEHIAKHGQAPVIERVLLGEPAMNKPGLFTQLDAEGKPVLGPDGRYATNAEWSQLRDAHTARLQALADAGGEALPPRTDQQMAREIFAEQAADYLLGRSSSFAADLQSTWWTRPMRAIANSEFVSNVPAMRALMGKLGVPLVGSDRRVLGSGLFPNGLPASRELQTLISRYTRRSASGQRVALDDEPGNLRFTKAEIEQHPQILDRIFDATDDVKRDANGRVLRDKAGRPMFNTPKEQRAARAALAQAISEALEKRQQTPAAEASPASATAPGAVSGAAATTGAVPPVIGEKPPEAPPARYERIEENGRVKDEGWTTPWIPDDVLDGLAASGKFNPVQIENLRQVSHAIRRGAGQSALFVYQPATSGGRKYESLRGDPRTEAPYSIFISKAGNVVIRTMSREKLMANVQTMIDRKLAAPWSNDRGAIVRDIDRYLANHVAGRPGSDGIGEEKKRLINYLFGIKTKANAQANPAKETLPLASPILRSRRLDRINNLSPVEEYFPTRYEMLNANLRPEPAP